MTTFRGQGSHVYNSQIYGADRTPPSYLDDEEAVKWLEGWDQ